MTLYCIVRRIGLYETVPVTRFPGTLELCLKRVEKLKARHPESCYEVVVSYVAPHGPMHGHYQEREIDGRARFRNGDR